MESKLPKPSALRRPTSAVKNILPTDRIKVATVAFGNRPTQPFGSNHIPPLSRDLTNVPNGIKENERAQSPDLLNRIATQTRAKLRRSRSACDIRDMPPLKRLDTTFSQSSTKSRFVLNSIPSNSVSRPQRIASVNVTLAPKRPSPKDTIIGRSAAKVAKKPSSNSGTSTSISTTGSGTGKAINKRIPPYDFKARYNDLLEKHKVLKEKYETKCEQMGNMEGLPEQLEESQAQLYSTQEQLKNVQTDSECYQRQIKSQNIKIETITKSLVITTDELEHLKAEHDNLKSDHRLLSTEVIQLRTRTADLSSRNTELLEEITACKEQLFSSNMERKELHNTVMDLRGNIRVFCRIRPPLECEQDKLECGWNYIDEATVEIQNLEGSGKNKPGAHVFSFDYVFHAQSTQKDIFEMVSPLIQSALDGYNICIFAYGQTGSGKTYTMDGDLQNFGVIPRTVDLLFDSIKNYKRLGWEYDIKVTFLEIYNEVLYDLLSNEQKEMEIRMVKNSKNDIYVSNITEETVTSAGRLRQLMQVAKMNRATAATVGNERSSRSHAVTKIELIGKHSEKNEVSIGSINLVDLAGSESPKTSLRMNETKNINRSLSELTNVILALLQKQDHIPYRNSKLTHLLMPALGGNSKTLMFINVAPFQECFVESVKSLRFAASVNSCKVAKARRNRFLNTSSNERLGV